MAAKSPTPSLRRRELIGFETFSQRREVFDQHDTVFLPAASPVTLAPGIDVEPIVTTNQGATASNFVRNGPTYSSMRDARDGPVEFRARKYSDNFTADLNRSDDDYRASLTERTRRLSKMRREFLRSQVGAPEPGSPFARSGVRASLPAKSSPLTYKIESPNLYKFPFAEPYTPTPTRKVLSLEFNDDVDAKDKENENPEAKHQSLPADGTKKIDHQKLFDELVKRYSPQRKPVDWTLPPTKPRVVGAVPKANTPEGEPSADAAVAVDSRTNETPQKEATPNAEVVDENDSKASISDNSEKRDNVPELRSDINWNGFKAPNVEKPAGDLSIPAIIDKMNAEGNELETHKKDTKKVKRKRSFLDKVLGRNKNK